MIRQLALLAGVVICLSASTTTNAVVVKYDSAKGLKTLQNVVSHIFWNEKLDDDFSKVGKAFDLQASARKYDAKYQKIVAAFIDRYESGMVPRGAIFSSNNRLQQSEVELIYRVFYFAPNLWELSCAALWAFSRLNRNQLGYTLRIALEHRKDTTQIRIPTLCQVVPEFCFNSDYMKQVYDFKIGLNDLCESNETVKFTAEAKYTNWYTIDTTDCEWNLTYFLEDIGLGDWFYSYSRKYPIWISSAEYNLPNSDRRGEIYGYVYKWILSRYNIERLSNNLDEVEFIKWDEPISIGYSPSMNFPNGMQFPRRKEHSTVPVSKKRVLHRLIDSEMRMTAAIYRMSITLNTAVNFVDISNGTGINLLGNLIQGNRDSVNPNYYGEYDRQARYILGFSPTPQTDTQTLPSALAYAGTSLRDPGFYRLVRKVSEFFYMFQANLPPYTKEQLGCDGVKINSVSIAEKNVTTYFEWFDTVISDFRFDHDKRSAVIKARQYRLNHKPVTLNLKITSDRDMNDAIIRIFVGPKYNVWRKKMSEHYKYFYEVDYFLKKLRRGVNTFQRTVNSTSGGTLYDFPNHLIFPKGKAEGLPVQFFCHVSKFNDSQHRDQRANLLISDKKPLGYPLDRPLFDFNMPNMALLDSVIYHRE